MAVADLVIETGDGIEGADAYCDSAFVLAYFENIGDVTFDGESADVVKASIRKATQFFDIEWGARARGDVLVEDQGLVFPRDDDTGIPLKLKQAIAELAKMAMAGPLAGAGATVSAPNAASIQKMKAGDVEIAFGERVKSRVETEVADRFYLIEKLVATFLLSSAINTRTAR